jgi:hypothetical protein
MQHGIARKPWHTNTLRLVTLALIAKETLVVATEIPPSPVIAAVNLLAHTCKKKSCCCAVLSSDKNDEDGADVANASNDATVTPPA